jgi:O-antigen/teichoic acid export membrane protein
LALGLDLPGIVLLLVISRVLALAAHSLFCLELCPALGRNRAFSRSLVRSLLGFGGWVTLSAALNPILVYLERFLIGALLSVAAVGFYTPPYMISSRLTIIPLSLTATLLPAFSTSAGRGDGEWIRNALVRSLKYLLLIMGPAALMLIFFARPLLTFWVGEKFSSQGTLVLQILAAGLLINSFAYVPWGLLQGIGRPDLTAKFYVLEVPLYIGLAWFLVTKFGLPGAALAWAVRVSVDFLLLTVAACWVTGTSPRLLAARDILISVAAFAALAVGFSALWIWSHALLADAFFTALLTAGFLLGAWHFILGVEEKWQLRLWLKADR